MVYSASSVKRLKTSLTSLPRSSVKHEFCRCLKCWQKINFFVIANGDF